MQGTLHSIPNDIRLLQEREFEVSPLAQKSIKVGGHLQLWSLISRTVIPHWGFYQEMDTFIDQSVMTSRVTASLWLRSLQSYGNCVTSVKLIGLAFFQSWTLTPPVQIAHVGYLAPTSLS